MKYSYALALLATLITFTACNKNQEDVSKPEIKVEAVPQAERTILSEEDINSLSDYLKGKLSSNTTVTGNNNWLTVKCQHRQKYYQLYMQKDKLLSFDRSIVRDMYLENLISKYRGYYLDLVIRFQDDYPDPMTDNTVRLSIRPNGAAYVDDQRICGT